MPKFVRVEDIKKVCNPYKDEDVPVFEIVFCKDCEYYMDTENGRQKHTMCGQLGFENWYCADAKRREDDEIQHP